MINIITLGERKFAIVEKVEDGPTETQPDYVTLVRSGWEVRMTRRSFHTVSNRILVEVVPRPTYIRHSLT